MPLLLVTSSFLLLVVRPGATSSVLAPSGDALAPDRSVSRKSRDLDALGSRKVMVVMK